MNKDNTTGKPKNRQRNGRRLTDELPILPPTVDENKDHVYEVFLYDVPKRWNETKVEETVRKNSDKVYSISIKKQFKYQTVKIKVTNRFEKSFSNGQFGIIVGGRS